MTITHAITTITIIDKPTLKRTAFLDYHIFNKPLTVGGLISPSDLIGKKKRFNKGCKKKLLMVFLED